MRGKDGLDGLQYNSNVVITMRLSVLVLNGNGTDLAKYYIPAVSCKRISVTFRKMDKAKRPHNFKLDLDLQI
ncbi:hypothetical protein IEQ34_004197 [Dendrobium chrysotoxum]|uniref:Uncharacterized protein n=1 Tax=Dendrobium chrysotoxum TaxID=161865 RepID=A0AAV7HFR8_DENCH|nr:hypothetical protein IEQ34_004012 [Dendrobium chrysotoxum]KAH0466959.1 hypothetical protein IEQ34_004197 [Dendrobium chrysotoxum]